MTAIEILDSFLDFIKNGKPLLKTSRNGARHSIDRLIQLHCGCVAPESGRHLLITCAVFLRRDCRLITIYFDYTTRNDYTASRPSHVTSLTGNTAGDHDVVERR